MLRYLGKRVLSSMATVVGIVIIVFFIVRVLPGDAAIVRAGPYATQEKIDQIRAQYGFSDPLPVQFKDYMSSVFTGDLGTSIRTGGNVTTELVDRLPASLELAFYAVILAALIGIPIGILAAARKGTWIDGASRVFAVLGSSMALFWLGLLLIYFLFFRLRWFPGPIDRLAIGTKPPGTITGFYTIDAALHGDFGLMWEAFRYLALPVLTLGLVLAAPILKMVRASMIDALESEHVRTARALGVPYRQVLFRDGFRNALLPVTTAIGIVFGYMLGGNIIVEFLFAWPGVGRYAYSAIQVNDLEALQGFVIVVGVLYVALNVVIDLVYAWIDPRIRLGHKVDA
ncbi:MAG TPA: peptide ABC transporter permease [Actinobacteria bacterium]|nr:peptide ABC transporter permease [Actinomycetota bacterium]